MVFNSYKIRDTICPDRFRVPLFWLNSRSLGGSLHSLIFLDKLYALIGKKRLMFKLLLTFKALNYPALP